MTQLILAALFFIALHIGVAGTSARGIAIEKLGENVYRAAFSLLSLLGIVWLSYAYRVAGYIETWGQLAWFKPIAALLMLVAFLLLVLGMTTPNPMAGVRCEPQQITTPPNLTLKQSCAKCAQPACFAL